MIDIVEIMASFVESGIVVVFCNRYLGFRNKRMMYLKSLIFFIVLLTENILFTQREWHGSLAVLMEILSTVCIVLLVGAYAFLFLEGKLYEKIFVAFFPILTILPINLIVFNMVRTLSGEFVVDIIEPGGQVRIPTIIFSKLAFFLLCEFVVHMRRRRKYSLDIFQWSIQLSCFLLTFLIAFLQLNISKKNDNMPEFLSVSILIAVLNILLYILLDRMKRDNLIKDEYRISRISLAAQERLVNEAREQYMEMKTLRHDMRHYLITAADLIAAGKTVEAREYIEKIINEKVNTTVSGIDTGNVVIDAVINNHIAACRRKHIEIKCMIDSGFRDVDDMDISILLSNVLDNAIRGCGGVEKPEIELVMGTRKTLTYIIVKNTIPSSVLDKNPDLVTDKENRPAHGFGLMSVRKIAEKYGGSVECREENGLFVIEVWLEKTEESTDQK